MSDSEPDEAPVVGTSTALDLVNAGYPATVTPKHFVFYNFRYYSHYVLRNVKNIEGNNTRVLLHSNNLCVVCLDPSHVIFQQNLVINEVSYDFKRQGKQRNNAEEVAAIKGKKKKNALKCFVDMPLALVRTACGREFKVTAGIDGNVLEMNGALMDTPRLVQDCPLAEGYFAIINPDLRTTFSKFELVCRAVGSNLEEREE